MATRIIRPLRTLLVFFAVVAAPASGGADLTPANVSSLALKWEAPIGHGVTAQTIVANGLAYVPSWDGKLHALDPATGKERWVFQPAGGFLSGAVLATPDRKIYFGSALSDVYCLRGDDGSLVWHVMLGKAGVDAVWSQLSIANGRLLVGIASLQDKPCTHGRLFALDPATGAELWHFQTVPDKVCSTDTGIACTSDNQCNGGTCVDGKGGGVTATSIFDPTGNFVYMNTVGCYTFPSIGDSDAIFKLDAATGAVIWKNRVTPPEQFGMC